ALHHLRKLPGGDALDAVSGTAALTGAADTAWVMRRIRGRAEATVFVTGRDVREAEVALRFDPLAGGWMLAAGPHRSVERQRVLDLLRDASLPLGPKEVGEALGKSHGTAKWLLAELARAGDLL